MRPQAEACATEGTPGTEARGTGYGYAPQFEDDQGPGGLVEYWRILRRRKGTLVVIAFLGALLGLLVTLPQTPIYQAQVSLEIQDLNQNFMNMKDVSPVSESSPLNALTDIQTQIKILQSETLIEGAIGKLKIARPEDAVADPSRVAAWRKALNLAGPVEPETADARVKRFAKNLKVRAAGQTRIIEVLFDSTDPKLAADFANALANEFIDQNVSVRWKMTQRTGEWLGRQLDEMRIKLERSEDELQAYARRTGLLFTSEKTNVNDEKLRQLQESLSKAQADRIARQSRYEIARTSPPETLADVLNDSSLREYQKVLTDLRRQHSELSATYKPEYSKVQRVQAQIVTVESALKRERENMLRRIENDFQEAQRREKLLAADYANQARLVTEQSEKTIHYNILKREVDSNRQLYDSMLQRVKESSVAAAMRASNMRIVDQAKAPRLPYKPSVVLNTALGLMSGLFLGVVFIVMRERADRSIQEPGDLPFYLNVPELGVIPRAEAAARKSLYTIRRKKLPAPAVSTETAVVAMKDMPDQVELASWQHKPSLVAESFRAILASILFSGENGNRPRVLVVTSGSPKEGKSTVASNLGIALAEVHQRVLLIDGDMRKPRLHEIFGIDNERGLSDLLREQAPLAETGLAGVVQETTVPNLFVLPSGPQSSAAATLLFSQRTARLVAELRKEFDSILIDTPPMLQMPDARVIGRLADAVILVVRAGATTRDAAIAASERLQEDGTPVLGTILNDWNAKWSSGGYYKHYYAPAADKR